MRTDKLIDFLSRGEGDAVRPARALHLILALAGGLIAAIALLLAGFGVREDFTAAPMPVMMKAMFSAFAAAAILPLAARLMRPGRPLGWRIGAVCVFVGVSALAACLALLGEAPGDRLKMWLGGSFPWCLVLIPLLAAPAAALIMWFARGLAPTQLGLTGAAIGALSGGIGAMAYSMYCPVDSIAFVTTWYVAAIALCAALGALIGGRLLRW